MAKPPKGKDAINRTYVLSRQHIDFIESWAIADDRSVSAMVRKLIDCEAKRREVQDQTAIQN